MKYDRIGAMNRARERKPQTGGKLYRQTASRAPVPEKGSWERLTQATQARWEGVWGDALAQYQFDVFGDQWAGL